MIKTPFFQKESFTKEILYFIYNKEKWGHHSEKISFKYSKDLSVNIISLGKEDKEKMIKFRPIAHNVRELLPLLHDYLEKDKDICLTYLFGSFGSFASGKVRKLSDVDIVVLQNEKLEEERWQ